MIFTLYNVCSVPWGGGGGGISWVPWADVMNTVGGYLEYRGGVPTVLMIAPPTCIMISPMVLMISPTCIMILPRYSLYSSIVLNTPRYWTHIIHDESSPENTTLRRALVFVADGRIDAVMWTKSQNDVRKSVGCRISFGVPMFDDLILSGVWLALLRVYPDFVKVQPESQK